MVKIPSSTLFRNNRFGLNEMVSKIFQNLLYFIQLMNPQIQKKKKLKFKMQRGKKFVGFLMYKI